MMIQRPITADIPAQDSIVIAFNPGVAVYRLRLVNSNGKSAIASITFDRATGTLTVVSTEKGV